MRQTFVDPDEFDFTSLHGIDMNFLLNQLFYLKSVVLIDTINTLCGTVTYVLKFMINSYESDTVCHLFVDITEGTRLRFYNRDVFWFEFCELMIYLFQNLCDFYLPMGIVLLIFYQTCKYNNSVYEKEVATSDKYSEEFNSVIDKNLIFKEEIDQKSR